MGNTAENRYYGRRKTKSRKLFWISDFDPRMIHQRKILTRNYHLLAADGDFSKLFPRKSFIAGCRRLPNLMELVSPTVARRADTPPPQPPTHPAPPPPPPPPPPSPPTRYPQRRSPRNTTVDQATTTPATGEELTPAAAVLGGSTATRELPTVDESATRTRVPVG